MEGEDGLDEGGDSGGRAAEPAEESHQDLRVAMACSTSARIFVWDRFTAC